MKIEKKILPEYFDPVASGVKKFEIRLADWECNVGDVLVLREWDPELRNYTGRVTEKKITYIRNTKDVSFFPPEDVEKYGYQILSLE